MTKTTDGAARAESNLFELCRVVTEEDRRSTIDTLGNSTAANSSRPRCRRPTSSTRRYSNAGTARNKATCMMSMYLR